MTTTILVITTEYKCSLQSIYVSHPVKPSGSKARMLRQCSVLPVESDSAFHVLPSLLSLLVTSEIGVKDYTLGGWKVSGQHMSDSLLIETVFLMVWISQKNCFLPILCSDVYSNQHIYCFIFNIIFIISVYIFLLSPYPPHHMSHSL